MFVYLTVTNLHWSSLVLTSQNYVCQIEGNMSEAAILNTYCSRIDRDRPLVQCSLDIPTDIIYLFICIFKEGSNIEIKPCTLHQTRSKLIEK